MVAMVTRGPTITECRHTVVSLMCMCLFGLSHKLNATYEGVTRSDKLALPSFVDCKHFTRLNVNSSIN